MNPLRSLAVGSLAIALSAQATEHEVLVNTRDSFFDPKHIEIQAGDTVRWRNMGLAGHNVTADNGSFRCANGCDGEGGNGSIASNAWNFTRTFSEPGEIAYHCQHHGGPGGVGMAGTVTVLPAQDPEPEFAINFGLTGSWFNPATSGQGFLFDVVVAQEPPQMVVYWFTYDTESGGPEAQRWFVAQGPIEGETDTVTLDVLLVTGGIFNQPEPVEANIVGTAELTFASCTEATLTFNIDFNGDPGQNISGAIPIERLSPDVLCEELRNGSQNS